jgi:hypothetical protein
MPREAARVVVTDSPTEPIRLALCRGPYCDAAEISPLRALALAEELLSAARSRLRLATGDDRKAAATSAMADTN